MASKKRRKINRRLEKRISRILPVDLTPLVDIWAACNDHAEEVYAAGEHMRDSITGLPIDRQIDVVHWVIFDGSELRLVTRSRRQIAVDYDWRK